MKISNLVFAIMMIVVAVTELSIAGDDQKSVLPDNKTIDTFEYTFAPNLAGSHATLSIYKDGKVTYSYVEKPFTGSGGKTVRKEWKITEREREALLSGLITDGLLNIESVFGGKYPSHSILLSYGRWRLSLQREDFPQTLLNRIKPLLQEAHPEKWGTSATDRSKSEAE